MKKTRINNYESPILGKTGAHKGWDYKPFTWTMFLKLRKWAQKAAKEEGGHIYLVGSVLTKYQPRDIDIAIIIPIKEFEKRFGKVPRKAGTPELNKYMQELREKNIDRYHEANMVLGYHRRVDLRYCPDVWWTEKEKFLLA